MLRKITQTIRLTHRSQVVGFAFYRYGLAGLLANLGMEVGKRGLRAAKVMGGSNIALDSVMGKNLAKTFMKLGPTFIKLGQMLASRPDLVGEPVSDELKVLFDRVTAIPFAEIEKILVKELGRAKIKKHFQSIHPQPLASASISQTHQAVLADGTPVILKVQKTGVGELVRLDLELLEAFLKPLHFVYPKWNLMQMFHEFRDASLREIDYREEAKNIAKFQRNYRKIMSDSDVVFPGFYAELTTERVLVLEPMQGKKLHELRKGSTVARHAAEKSLAAVLEQIFDHGFFHADPHAGNLFFMEDEGRLGFIDMGLVGQLQQADKQRFLKVLIAILKRDRTKLAKALFDMGTPSKKTKYDKFEAEIQAMLDEVKNAGVNNVRLDKMVNQLLGVARKNGVHIPNRYVLMLRSCLVIEGVAKTLDPNVRVADIAIPIVAKSLMRSYNPLRLFRRG